MDCWGRAEAPRRSHVEEGCQGLQSQACDVIVENSVLMLMLVGVGTSVVPAPASAGPTGRHLPACFPWETLKSA